MDKLTTTEILIEFLYAMDNGEAFLLDLRVVLLGGGEELGGEGNRALEAVGFPQKQN